MKYVELFAGAGGMSLGLERAGLTCVAHAEIAEFPRRVLAHHWPDVPLYGDVSKVDGLALVAEHGPIDLLAGGSPCQDMSVAGKRAGLAGARSGLFYEQLRLWEETGATYLLWENVAGALSSNEGKDFAAVLSAIVGATVAVPRDGWGGDESGGGVAAGPTGVAAWRLLDAQWFGVPQRRLRVFVLGARTGGVDPAEVLLEPEGVCGHPPSRREAGERVARGAGAGAPVPLLEVGKRTGVSTSDLRAGSGIGDEGDPMFTLQASAQHGVIAFDNRIQGEPSDVAPCVTGSHGNHGMVLSVTGEITHALTHEGHDASEDGTGRGTPIVAYFDKQALGVYGENGVASTDSARDYKDATDLIVPTLTSNGDAHSGFRDADGQAVSVGIPRRLMPVECERLMDWPDGWTDVPDEKGKAASDAVRYKACGNGVVSACSEWIGERLLQVAA